MRFLMKIIATFILLIIIGTIGNIILQCFREKRAYKAAHILCDIPNSNEAEEAENFFQENKGLFIPALIRIAKDEGEEIGIRTMALLLIGTNRAKEAVVPLCKLLFHNNWKIRFFSAQALGEIRDKRATEKLSYAWLTEGSKKVKDEIGIALAKIRDKKALPTLLETYKSKGDDDRYIQILSGVILYKITEDNRYFNLIVNAVNQEEYKIRGNVIYVLGQIGDKKDIPLLKEALDDEDLRIRKLAHMCIETIERKAK